MSKGDFIKEPRVQASWAASVLIHSMVLAALLSIIPLTAMGQSGEFRVSNYATGTNYNDFFWRGYAFKVNREVTVTGLIGGWGNAGTCSATAFSGALYSASDTGGTLSVSGEPPQPRVRKDSLLATVSFDRASSTTGTGGPTAAEIEAGRASLSEPVTLLPGQLYIIAQGSHNNGANCHFASTQIDVQNLLQGSAIIDEWYPGINQAYRFAAAGTPQSRVGVSADRLDAARVLVGFEYLTDVTRPTLQTQSVQVTGPDSVTVTGNLGDSGQTDAAQTLTLYFEWADNPAFTSASLQTAQPSTVNGPATNVPFSIPISGLDPDVEYFVRAVAINEAGRTNANVLSFTISAIPLTPAIPVPVNNPWILLLLVLLTFGVAVSRLRRRTAA